MEARSQEPEGPGRYGGCRGRSESHVRRARDLRTGVTMALNRHPVDPGILSDPKKVLGDSSRALRLCGLLLKAHLEGSKNAKNLEESLFVRHGCAPAHGRPAFSRGSVFSQSAPCGRLVLACWHDRTYDVMYKGLFRPQNTTYAPFTVSIAVVRPRQ